MLSGLITEIDGLNYWNQGCDFRAKKHMTGFYYQGSNLFSLKIITNLMVCVIHYS